MLESAARRADGLWTAAIVDPDGFDRRADEFAAATRTEAGAAGRLSELVDGPPVAGASNSDRLAAFVEAAAAALAVLGRPVRDPLEALDGLPEIAPGEPCPVVRDVDAAPGWLSIWEVTHDGAGRNAVAVFHTDTGSVRPDLAVTIWERCSRPLPIVDHRTPETALWDRIMTQGVDHAYVAAARLAGGTALTLPDARLRLLVRVDP